MESGRFLFNPPPCGGNMLYLGGAGSDPVLRGQFLFRSLLFVLIHSYKVFSKHFNQTSTSIL